jgi:hypothetical protein
MRTEIECLIIGLISALCCMISYKIIYGSTISKSKTKSKTKSKNIFFFLKYQNLRNNIIFCFLLGAIIHYIIKKNDLTNMYCKKVCYDNQCFMVCPI